MDPLQGGGGLADGAVPLLAPRARTAHKGRFGHVLVIGGGIGGLTAALLKSGLEMGVAEWMVLTYAVGVGGSLLVIGSASGIVAMSKVPGLTFGSYLRHMLYLFVAFNIGFAGVYLIGLSIG